MAAVPIITVALMLRYLMVEFSPLKPIPGDMAYIGPGSSKGSPEKEKQWQYGRIGTMLLVVLHS